MYEIEFRQFFIEESHDRKDSAMKLVSFDKKEDSGEAVVSVTKNEFDKKLNVVYNYQKKWFNVPGFRKGKVPRGIIENSYGKDIFYDGAMQEFYVDIMNFLQEEKDEKFMSVKSGIFGRVSSDFSPSVSRVNDGNIEIKVPLSFYPHTYVKFENMSVEVENEKKASKEDIENQRSKLFDKYSTFEKMDDGYKVVNGDLANVEIRVAFVDENDNDLPENEQYDVYTDGLKNFEVGVGSGRAWKEFEECLIGHSKSEGEFSNVLTFPENEKLDLFSGRRVRFNITINHVKHLTPPSNDKLLEILKMKSDDELNLSLEREINERNHSIFERGKESMIQQNLQDQIPDDLICKSLLEERFDDSFKRFERNLKSGGMSIDSYCEIVGQSVDSVKEDLRKSISDDMKLRIALLNASELLKLSASKDEIDEGFKKIAKSNRISASFAKENIPVSEVQASILCDKAMEYVKNHVSVKEPHKTRAEKSSEVSSKKDDVKEEVEASETKEDKSEKKMKKTTKKTRKKESKN